MTSTTKTAREIAKQLIIEHGDCITLGHIGSAADAAGVHICDVQSALNYFKHSAKQAAFRDRYGFGK